MFDFNRFWLLVRRQAVENYKFYLLAIGLMAGLLAMYYSLTFRALGREDDYQQLSFFLSLCLSGSVFMNMLTKELHQKTTAVWYLMIPASPLEKLLSALLYGMVLFALVHLAVFCAVDAFFVSLYNTRFPDKPAAHLLDLFSHAKKTSPYQFYYFFVAIQSVMLLGTVRFERYAYVKTTVSFLVLVILVLFVNQQIANVLVPANSETFPFYELAVVSGEGFDMEYTRVSLPDPWRNVVLFVFRFLLAPFLCLTAYFQLKEKEV